MSFLVIKLIFDSNEKKKKNFDECIENKKKKRLKNRKKEKRIKGNKGERERGRGKKNTNLVLLIIFYKRPAYLCLYVSAFLLSLSFPLFQSTWL